MNMKTFQILLALTLTLIAASAQFVQPPAPKSAIAGSTVLTIVGGSTSNLSDTVRASFQVGASGFGATFNIAGTNAATTTNVVVRLDVSGDGVNWVANAITLNATPSGTGWTPSFTNVLSTAANVGNLSLARIASIQNTNLASIFVTNITITTR